MRPPGYDLTKSALFALACLASTTVGCGNSCFVGYSANGNGGVVVKAGNPPPVCTLDQARGNVQVAMAKSVTCQDCAPVAEVRHMFIELHGLQIHSYGEDEDAGWLDLTPEFAKKPLELDLVGETPADIHVTSSIVPAGTYDALRLQFGPNAPAGESEARANPERCNGGKGSNCLMMGDGRTQELSFAGRTDELVLPIAGSSGPLPLVPDSTARLQIRLGARQATEASVPLLEGLPMRLIGEVAIQRGTD